MARHEASASFQDYFVIFPWDDLWAGAEGFDMSCGSGRWSSFVAPKVGWLHCIDPSDALQVGCKTSGNEENVTFHRASIANNPLRDPSQDFGHSLGVLQHVQDTAAAVHACAQKLKPGAPLLLYLYYAFDSRSLAPRLLWRASDLLRRFICRLRSTAKHLVTDVIAAATYLPLARLALRLECLGAPLAGLRLPYYRNCGFYTIRTDSRDRFGTPLEQSLSCKQIEQMMEQAGLRDIVSSDRQPVWCAVGKKA